MHQPRQPALQTQTVDDKQFGIRDLFGVRRRRRIDVHVAVGTDQGGHADPVAADIADEIADDRKAGDDVEMILGMRDGNERHEDQADQPGSKMPHGVDLYASRWRPGNNCLTRPPTLPNSIEATLSTAATRMIAGPDGIRV